MAAKKGKKRGGLDAVIRELQKVNVTLQHHSRLLGDARGDLDAIHETLRDHGLLLRDHSAELKLIRGDLEEVKTDVKSLATRETARHLDLDLRLRRVERHLGLPTTPPVAGHPGE